MNAAPQRLDLADVGLLVVAADGEAPGVAADDHMAQRHRREAELIGKPPEKPP